MLAAARRTGWAVWAGRLLAVIWPFLLIVVVLVGLGEYRNRVMAGVRAYAVGNGLWIDAQKEAVAQLQRYAATGDDAFWQRYREEILVPLSDLAARLELEKDSPDLDVVRRYLVAGRNDPQDLDAVLALFRTYGDRGDIGRAVALWRQGDAMIVDINASAEVLHTEIVAGHFGSPTAQKALARIDQLDAELAPLGYTFATAMSAGARQLQARLGMISLGSGLVMLLLGLLLSARAVRRQIAVENALRASEERYALVAEATNDGIWDWDLQTNQIYFSPRVREMLGYGLEQLSRTADLKNIVLAEDYQVARDAVHAHIDERQVGELHRTMRMRTRDGRVIWVLARSVNLYDKEGKPLRVAGSYTDISEQVRNEQRLQLAASVFEAGYEGMLITDPRNRIISANRAMQHLTGFSNEELAGRHVLRLRAKSIPADTIRQAVRSFAEQGHWRGEVAIQTRSGEQRPVELSVVEVRDAAGQPTYRIHVCRDIAELKYAQARIRHLAYFDALTGLPNRSYLATQFDNLLAAARKRGEPLAVVFFDLDGFKEINDTLGHSAGDIMIRTVARRLGAGIRDSDVLCRFGGDEFLLLLPGSNHDDTMQSVGRLLQNIDQPLQLEGHSVSITVSAGFSLFPDDATDAETLVRDADMALYQAKELGKNIVERYRPWMSTAVSWRHDMLAALRTGLAQRQFEMRFQPVVELGTGTVRGVEALLYWNHPQMGVISPASFIPLAEESGLIEPLGNWLIDESIRCYAQWQTEGLPRMYLAINVSGYQLRRAEALQACVLDAADRHGVAHEDIVLEITERQIVYDLAASLPVLEDLASRGVRLSIDDFGTGYSSLEYLKDMPVSQIKIDRTFVHKLVTEVGDRAIVSAIISLGRSLGLQVVAEGVENAQQLTLLKSYGCDAVQGYYYARPLAAAEVPEAVRKLQA